MSREYCDGIRIGDRTDLCDDQPWIVLDFIRSERGPWFAFLGREGETDIVRAVGMLEGMKCER